MTEEELRALVRQSIVRHLGAAAHGTGEATLAPPGHRPQLTPGHWVPLAVAHTSHTRFRLSSGGEGDGACLIEPHVECTHCGYCQSYGH